MRVLGIDYGAARIGIALGDTDSCIASPWSVIDAKVPAQALLALQELIRAERVESLVVGMPRRLHDQRQESKQTQEVRRFMESLVGFGLPIFEQNETWSSKFAARQVQELGQKGKRDDLAAAIILQSYLDRYGVSS